MTNFVAEEMARRDAVKMLRTFAPKLDKLLGVMYENSPGYAGEVEGVKETIEAAIRVLSGEPDSPA